MANKANDLFTLNPVLASEWHPINNGNLTPKDIAASSHKKVWWLCKEGHEWDAVVKSRNNGAGCPYCSNQRVLSGYNDLTTTHPELAHEWHPTKNGELIPQQISSGMHKKVWWLGLCGHNWEASISNRKKGRGCPICSNKLILVGVNDLTTTHPELAHEWHPTKNGELIPQQISSGSQQEIWWSGLCGHEWKARLSSRSLYKQGCAVCSNRQIEVGFNDLATTHSELAAQWHPTKNGELTPQQVSFGSNKKVWWLGLCGHEWDAVITRRVQGNNCPVCTGKTILIGYNDLSTTHPNLASEWHPNKNGGLKPEQFSSGSRVKVWWLGVCGHEWESTIASRRNGCAGCKLCPRKKLNFESLPSELVSEWHPTKNGGLALQEVSSGTRKKAWWLGACGHEWEANIFNRTRGTGCPICANKRILVGFNDLAATHPDLASEWHPTKNDGVTPNQIINSSKKMWWLGICGHEWEALISDRKHGIGCPVCANMLIITGINDMATTHPELAAQWHPTKNGELTPGNVSAGSNKSYIWECKKGHEWKAQSNSRKNGNGCPVCSNKLVVAGVNDLATTHPRLASEWHPTKNRKLTPQQFSYGTSNSVWWLGLCTHEWYAAISDRSNNSSCPVCAGQQVVTGFNDLATTHVVLAAEWHPTKNGELTPQKVSYGMKRKVWWLGACRHEWDAGIKGRANQQGCPYCSNQRLLEGFNDLLTRNPELAAEWHPTRNGELGPSKTISANGMKVWWQCSKNHEWEAMVSLRKMGTGCPSCTASLFISRAEQAIHDYLKKMKPSLDIEQSNRTILKRHELDMYIPSKKLAIEFNGVYWHSEEAGKVSDYHFKKWEECKQVGIRLIQVWEDDWNFNPGLIKENIMSMIQEGAREPDFQQDCKVAPISENDAREFMETSHIERFVDGSAYLGLFLGDNSDLKAVLILGNTKERGPVHLLRYAAVKDCRFSGLKAILSYVIDQYQPAYITASVDNCGTDGVLFEEFGFSEEGQEPPTRMHVYKSKRIFILCNNCEDASNLTALNSSGGPDISDNEKHALYNHIWDAGRTIYRYRVQ